MQFVWPVMPSSQYVMYMHFMSRCITSNRTQFYLMRHDATRHMFVMYCELSLRYKTGVFTHKITKGLRPESQYFCLCYIVTESVHVVIINYGCASAFLFLFLCLHGVPVATRCISINIVNPAGINPAVTTHTGYITCMHACQTKWRCFKKIMCSDKN